MNGYKTALQALQESDGYGSSASDQSVKTYRFASVFVPSLAPPYPSIEDELRKDVAVLARSIDIRDRYIDDLREARDSLARKLDMRDLRIECLERDIGRYQEFFKRAREQENRNIFSD